MRRRVLELGKKAVTVELKATEPPQVELWGARKHGSLFRRAFGRRLKLRAQVS